MIKREEKKERQETHSDTTDEEGQRLTNQKEKWKIMGWTESVPPLVLWIFVSLYLYLNLSGGRRGWWWWWWWWEREREGRIRDEGAVERVPWELNWMGGLLFRGIFLHLKWPNCLAVSESNGADVAQYL